MAYDGVLFIFAPMWVRWMLGAITTARGPCDDTYFTQEVVFICREDMYTFYTIIYGQAS